MKHIIIGTAGHIDHGKTSLIRAITGKNTDRLKEEKDRGISIELGFTYFDLPNGKRAGIIDVPGHEKFIKNMLAGAMGMDIVLMVIAADEGVMPQTKEHLDILDLLGLDKGFIVLTKSDLVEGEWLDLVKEDVEEEVKGTFLEGAPIIPVSTTQKKGIDEVINLIDILSLEIEDKERDDTPRLPVDRVFTMSGFGTVVTGTLLSGTINIGDEIQVFPGNKLARIRTLQVHDQDTKIAYGGQRVAINMAGIKKSEINRGDLLAPKDSMKSTKMLDVRIKLIKDMDKVITNRTRLRLYIGSKELFCRIVLLDKEKLNPGEAAYAQLRLEEPVVAKRKDKFIVRFYSPMFTIGGGIILEPNPIKRQPFDDKAIEELKIKEEGQSIDITERIILDGSSRFPTIKEIATATAMLEDRVMEDANELERAGRVKLFKLTKDLYVIHIAYLNRLKETIIEGVEAFHKTYPLREGIPKEEVRSRFLHKAPPKVGEKIIDLFMEEGLLQQSRDTILLKGFQIRFDDEQREIKGKIMEFLREEGFSPPRKEEIIEGLGYEYKETEEMINYLVYDGNLIKLSEDIFMPESILKKGLDLLIAYIENNGHITVAQYRDILDTSRKIALTLLEYFDQLKITKRDGDRRTLIKV